MWKKNPDDAALGKQILTKMERCCSLLLAGGYDLKTKKVALVSKYCIGSRVFLFQKYLPSKPYGYLKLLSLMFFCFTFVVDPFKVNFDFLGGKRHM